MSHDLFLCNAIGGWKLFPLSKKLRKHLKEEYALGNVSASRFTKKKSHYPSKL